MLGRLLEKNVDRPLVFVLGGMRRPEMKFELLARQLEHVDRVLVGGVIGNTFLKAANHEMGKSLYLPEFVEECENLLARAKDLNKTILMPVDIISGSSMDEESEATVRDVNSIEPDDLILDIGPVTRQAYLDQIEAAATIFWTGPLGVVELQQFQAGSFEIAKAVAAGSAYSVANGGDTLAIIETLNLNEGFSHLSTGGGSSLEFLQGKALPAVTMMEESARVRYAVEREY